MDTTFSQLEDAIDYVSSQPYGTNEAYISLDTGQVFYLSGFGDSDELPDDFEESDRYLEIPHKNDLDLGRRLVRDFTYANAGHLAEQVDDIFRHRGAYSGFKSLLESHGLLHAWYDFENQRTTKAIREWCAENRLHFQDQNQG